MRRCESVYEGVNLIQQCVFSNLLMWPFLLPPDSKFIYRFMFFHPHSLIALFYVHLLTHPHPPPLPLSHTSQRWTTPLRPRARRRLSLMRRPASLIRRPRRWERNWSRRTAPCSPAFRKRARGARRSMAVCSNNIIQTFLLLFVFDFLPQYISFLMYMDLNSLS